MRYIPGDMDDRILEVKFTSGYEYMTTDGKMYEGFYHLIGNTYFTGEKHSKDSNELIVYNSDPNYVKYLDLKEYYLLENYKPPFVYYPKPTEKDYENGYFKRYFVKQMNDENSAIIEIDKNQYDSLNTDGSGINEKFYYGIEVTWKITGPIYDVYTNGKLVSYGISDTNGRELRNKEKEMRNINIALSNLTEFANVFDT